MSYLNKEYEDTIGLISKLKTIMSKTEEKRKSVPPQKTKNSSGKRKEQQEF